MNEEIAKKLADILSLDDPSNYDDSDSACESITEEFDELSDALHHAICEAVEEWFVRGSDDEELEEDPEE